MARVCNWALTEYPLFRRKDPATSVLAAEDCKRSGRFAAQLVQVNQLVHDHPGCTAAELAGYGHLDRYMVSRRLPDLRRMKKIENRGQSRRCQVTGRRSLLWWAV